MQRAQEIWPQSSPPCASVLQALSFSLRISKTPRALPGEFFVLFNSKFFGVRHDPLDTGGVFPQGAGHEVLARNLEGRQYAKGLRWPVAQPWVIALAPQNDGIIVTQPPGGPARFPGGLSFHITSKTVGAVPLLRLCREEAVRPYGCFSSISSFRPRFKQKRNNSLPRVCLRRLCYLLISSCSDIPALLPEWRQEWPPGCVCPPGP